ncbi:hypothetical protein HDU91_003121, partial [Kappamyces sp. JEL0680]
SLRVATHLPLSSLIPIPQSALLSATSSEQLPVVTLSELKLDTAKRTKRDSFASNPTELELATPRSGVSPWYYSTVIHDINAPNDAASPRQVSVTIVDDSNRISLDIREKGSESNGKREGSLSGSQTALNQIPTSLTLSTTNSPTSMLGAEDDVTTVGIMAPPNTPTALSSIESWISQVKSNQDTFQCLPSQVNSPSAIFPAAPEPVSTPITIFRSVHDVKPVFEIATTEDAESSQLSTSPPDTLKSRSTEFRISIASTEEDKTADPVLPITVGGPLFAEALVADSLRSSRFDHLMNEEHEALEPGLVLAIGTDSASPEPEAGSVTPTNT